MLASSGIQRMVMYVTRPTMRAYATRSATIKGLFNTSRSAGGLPIVQTCPAPTCECQASPEGLDIETTQSLNGTMAAYAEQILISTGKSDWSSRIEDDADGELVRQLRSYIGPKGKYSNPFHNVLLTHSSFPRPPHQSSASAYLFPSFKYVSSLPLVDANVENFVKGFVLPTEPPRSDLAPAATVALQQPELQASIETRDVEEVVVLICSHNARDSRCGILGPLLANEFEDKLQRAGLDIGQGVGCAQVGMISHIGGHKWAGNVIVYLPPGLEHELAGTGIWYGRVGPEHVEGIVRETVQGGRIIQDLFRGGIDRQRKILRL